MSACEYCWGRRGFFGDSGSTDSYYAAMKDAEERKAPCTQDTLEGAKARAGQFWDEATQTDRRLQPPATSLHPTTKENQ